MSTVAARTITLAAGVINGDYESEATSLNYVETFFTDFLLLDANDQPVQATGGEITCLLRTEGGQLRQAVNGVINAANLTSEVLEMPHAYGVFTHAVIRVNNLVAPNATKLNVLVRKR
jgi:hypothetical protein